MNGAAGISAPNRVFAFTPASADPDVARMLQARGSLARMKRFTPAGVANSDERSVTVAVRIDAQAAQAITVRNAIAAANAEPASASPISRIAASRYNLGMARGYQSFAQTPVVVPSTIAGTPELGTFELPASGRDEPSRFAARIALEEEQGAAPAAPQSLGSVTDQRLDVAGSYRLSRNLDVTAGVRFEQDRNRMSALPNVEQQDSQAVYVGTQFRF
jgi:hypothetical protein